MKARRFCGSGSRYATSAVTAICQRARSIRSAAGCFWRGFCTCPPLEPFPAGGVVQPAATRQAQTTPMQRTILSRRLWRLSTTARTCHGASTGASLVSRQLRKAIAAARQVWPDLRETEEPAACPACGEARVRIEVHLPGQLRELLRSVRTLVERGALSLLPHAEAPPVEPRAVGPSQLGSRSITRGRSLAAICRRHSWTTRSSRLAKAPLDRWCAGCARV